MDFYKKNVIYLSLGLFLSVMTGCANLQKQNSDTMLIADPNDPTKTISVPKDTAKPKAPTTTQESLDRYKAQLDDRAQRLDAYEQTLDKARESLLEQAQALKDKEHGTKTKKTAHAKDSVDGDNVKVTPITVDKAQVTESAPDTTQTTTIIAPSSKKTYSKKKSEPKDTTADTAQKSHTVEKTTNVSSTDRNNSENEKNLSQVLSDLQKGNY